MPAVDQRASATTCTSAACCQRHPRLPACQKHATAVPFAPLAPDSSSKAAAQVSLLLSAPVAAYVPPWYVRAATRNWLRFTTSSTRIVMHMDRARATNFTTPELDGEWRWLLDGSARERVLINRLRLYTYRRSGSLLAAHVHNFLYALQALSHRPPTHILFLASNCFFIRPGVEGFIGERGASAAIRACPEAPIRANKHHCTTQPWFPELNAHRSTGRRLLIEGQFYPLRFMHELASQLQSRDAQGKPLRQQHTRRRLDSAADVGSLDDASLDGGGEHSLLRALLLAACTAEENLVPAVVLRASRSLFGEGPPTEPVAWIPKSLTNGTVVDSGAVRWLAGSLHTPQTLCHKSTASPGSSGGGCAICPDVQTWPQTKFVVKRVGDDAADRSGVRRLIASLPGARRPTNETGSQSGHHRRLNHTVV